jgi:hypothetical protein
MRERESNRLDPQPEKNIIHVGEKEPATTLRNGSTKYELPDAETQRKAFIIRGRGARPPISVEVQSDSSEKEISKWQMQIRFLRRSIYRL